MELLMSIYKHWSNKIFAGMKTIEVRKTAPNTENCPIKVYLYECKKYGGSGKIVGHFISNNIVRTDKFSCLSRIMTNTEETTKFRNHYSKCSCVPLNELYEYASNTDNISLYEINKVKKYNIPLELSDFGIKTVPISWIYLDKGSVKQ